MILSLTCPIDDLPLRELNGRIIGDVGRDSAEHLHLDFNSGAVACANGHRWRLETKSMTIFRVGN